jgi:cytochrome c oxidase subunit 2
MRHHGSTCLAAVVAPLLLSVPNGLAQEAEAHEGEPHEIQVTAKKYEFNPNVITVKKGEPIRLVLTALDRQHGFKIEALNIDVTLKKGVPTPVEFTADEAGTFEFKCSKFCGFGHGRMKGKLVVEGQGAKTSDE